MSGRCPAGGDRGTRSRRRQAAVVGLLTGNIRCGAEIKLRHFGLWHHFPFGGFADGLCERDDVARRAVAEAEAHVGRPIDADRFG